MSWIRILNIGATRASKTPLPPASLEQQVKDLLRATEGSASSRGKLTVAATKALVRGLQSGTDVHAYAAVRPQLDTALKGLVDGDKATKRLRAVVHTLDGQHVATILGWGNQGKLSRNLIRALANSPNEKVKAAVNQLIRGDAPEKITVSKPSIFARIFPAKTQVSPPSPERARVEIRKVSPNLPSRQLLRDAFEADAAGMHALSPALRKRYEQVADTVLAESAGAGKFLGFIANSAAATEGGDGMVPPQAIAYMHASLERAAKSLRGAEYQAAERVLRAYKGLLTSAVINVGTRQGRFSPADLQPDNALAFALSAKGAGMLESGHITHTTITRVAALPENESTLSVALMQHRKQAQQALQAAGAGSDGDNLHKSFHVAMKLEQVTHPSIRQLFSAKNCMVWPSSEPGHVKVTTLKDGALSHRNVPAHKAWRWIRSKNLQPIGDALKITLHNGGSGANVVGGATKSYDKRYSVPLSEASGVLAQIMGAVSLPKYEHRAFMGDMDRYSADSYASMAMSPQVAEQNLGNCTVHSQKLALLYAFQHTGDGIAGTPGAEELITPEAGKRLFATLWTAVLKETQTTALLARGGKALSESAQRGVDAELQWLGTLLSDKPIRARKERLAKPAPAAARDLAPSLQVAPKAHTPAPLLRPVPSRLTPIDESPPERPVGPPIVTIPGSDGAAPAPSRLAELVANPVDLPHLDPEIKTWYTRIHQKWWAPTTQEEAIAFRMVMHGISRSVLPERRQANGNWIKGVDRFRAAGEAAREGNATLPQLRDALFAILNDQAATRVRIPSALIKAWRDAANSSPLMAHLLREFDGLVT